METRTVTRYAWLPIRMGWEWLWLEWYAADEEWTPDLSGMAGARWVRVAVRRH